MLLRPLRWHFSCPSGPGRMCELALLWGAACLRLWGMGLSLGERVCVWPCHLGTGAGCRPVFDPCGRRAEPRPVVFPLAFEKKELCSLGAGSGVGECFLGGHIWWRPSAQGEASASWSWPGVAPSLQRWRGQRPASLHILNAVLNGQDGLVFLSSSGLNEHCPCHLRCALSALWREWSPRLTPLLPSERPLCPSGSALQPCWSLER